MIWQLWCKDGSISIDPVLDFQKQKNGSPESRIIIFDFTLRNQESNLNQQIDLRSDTVTRPTPEMRQAMAKAEVGDDVMRTDPTVIELEERAAELFGKDAALFVPSGTMANLLAILSQTSPGDEVLTHPECHIYYYEAGGYASVAGCSVKFVEDKGSAKLGVMSASSLQDSIRPSDIHFPNPKLFTIENTHNRGGGVIWPMNTLRETCAAAKESGLRIHTDGARIWNAAVGLGVNLKEIAADTDTISACLSKGLGCPVGSILVGDQATIDIARHKRKMLGGGMRQAGILAAAGLFALDHHYDRLEVDHTRAQKLANELASFSLFDFDPMLVETNLIYAKLAQRIIQEVGDAYVWEQRLKEAGVLCYAESSTTLRFVTHLDLTDVMIEEATSRIQSLCG
jgi:threonine aldolase